MKLASVGGVDGGLQQLRLERSQGKAKRVIDKRPKG
jgi:hypothetical protein